MAPSPKKGVTPSNKGTRCSPRKNPPVEPPELPKPPESREIQLERLLGELRAENQNLQEKVLKLEASQTNSKELLDRLKTAEALAKNIEQDKATIAYLTSQLDDRDRTIASKEEESANNREIVEQLQNKLEAERNTKTQDATRLQNKIDEIEKELEEAKQLNDDKQAAHNKLRAKLSEAKEENNHLSKAMEQMKIEMEEKRAEELADKAKSFETRLKEAEKRSRNLEDEKKRPEDRNHSLIEELRDVKEQAKERAKKHDQEIQDLRYEIQHEPEVDVRSDSATSPQPLNITIEDSPGDINVTSQSIEASPRDVNVTSQSTHMVEASPRDIKVTSQPSASVFASLDVSMPDLPSAQDPINSEITTVAQTDLPNSNLPPHDNPETVDVLMTDPSPMEPVSGSTKDGNHLECSNMTGNASTDLQNSGQIILPGDGAPTESAPDLRVAASDESLNPTGPDCEGKETCAPLPNEQLAVPTVSSTEYSTSAPAPSVHQPCDVSLNSTHQSTSLSGEQSAGPLSSSPKSSPSRADNGNAQKATISLLEKPSNDFASLKSSLGRQRSNGESSLPPGNGERSVEEPGGGVSNNSASKDSRDSPMVENDFVEDEGVRKNPVTKAKQTVPQPVDGNDAPTTRKSKQADHALATEGKTIPEAYVEQSRGHIHLRFLKQQKRKTTKRHKKLSLEFCSHNRLECESLGHIISLHSLRDIPQLCALIEDLDFSPNIIKLVSRCDLAKLSPADIEELTRLLQEIADHKNIPPSDDDELIHCLLDDIQLGQDHRSSSQNGLIASLLGDIQSGKDHRLSSKYDGELSVAHMLRRKLQLAKDEKHFLTILFYSVLAVYKFRARNEGEVQFYETMKDEFGELSNYVKQMIDVVLCLHWLCEEKDVAQAWSGRTLLLPNYLWRAGGGKLRTLFGALKRPMAYGMLRLLLSDPHFMAHHLPSDWTNSLGQKTPLSEVQDLLSGHVRPEVVRDALLVYSSTSTPSRSKLSASNFPNSNPPPHDRPENAEYSGDVLMTDLSTIEPVSGSTKDGGHSEYSNMIDDASTGLQNSGQVNQPGDSAPTESAQDLRGTSLNPTQPPSRPAGAAANDVKLTGKPSAKSSQRYHNGDSIDSEDDTSSPMTSSTTG